MPLNEIEHYGVIGMKWGVRRYQPYPNGHKKGVYLGDKVGHEPLKYKSPLVKNVKSTAKYVANFALAQVIPGYAFAYNINAIRISAKYNLDGKDYVKKQGAYEKVSELSRKASPTSPEDDVIKVNKGRASGQVNNCGYCTAAMEMRRRGYDVKARKKAQGISTAQYADWFDGVKPEASLVFRDPKQSRKEWVNASYDVLCKSIEKHGNGSRGYVAFQYEKMNSGHTLFWEVSNGSVSFYDAQSGKKNPGDVFSYSDQRYIYARLDNCKLKPEVTETCISSDYKKKKEDSK